MIIIFKLKMELKSKFLRLLLLVFALLNFAASTMCPVQLLIGYEPIDAMLKANDYVVDWQFKEVNLSPVAGLNSSNMTVSITNNVKSGLFTPSNASVTLLSGNRIKASFRNLVLKGEADLAKQRLTFEAPIDELTIEVKPTTTRKYGFNGS